MKLQKHGSRGEPMSLHEKVSSWIEIAEEDLATADVLLSNRIYLNAAYFCQQAVEKSLKANIQAQGKTPAMIHNLVRLAEKAGLLDLLDPEKQEFFGDLSLYAIEARYPERKRHLENLTTQEVTVNLVNRSKEMVGWLKEEAYKKLSQS